MNILVDADGVLFDFVSTYLDVLNAVADKRRFPSDVTTFNFAESISTKAEDAAVWDYIAKNPGIVYTMPIFPNVIEALWTLRRQNKVFCVTSPQYRGTWVNERYAALTDRLGFSKREIIFAADKSIVNGAVLIEDHAVNANDWAAANNPYGTALLINTPYNASAELQPNVLRVHDWKDIVSWLTAR